MTYEEIFLTAAEKTPAERAAYLDDACGGDADLRVQVEALLRSYEQAGSLLEQPLFRTGVCGDDTRTGPSVADGDVPLDFLHPSDKPGSIGRLGHYEVQEVVGRGGMGVVLRAFDETLHRVVAVKVMAPQLAASANARRRFTREARAAAAVTHDHIVTIHAVEESGPLPYIVMQFVAGASLQDRLDRTGTLQLHEILRIGMQTASGMAAAHAQGLVHRDVKPANILLENGVERVKLTDFGLARAADDASLTQSGTVAGTPSFMSPEQAEGKPVDARSDLFSLGSVLYAMCTGRPFRASTTMAVLKRVCEDDPRPVREANPEVPDWLAEVIGRLHAKDPAARYQSAAEVAEVLGRHLAHLQHPSVVPLPITVKPAAPLPVRRRHRWVAVAAVLALATAGLGLTEAAGVTKVRTTVIRFLTPDGTLVVETDDPDVKITIEGDGGLVITGAGPQEVRVRPGVYTVRVSKDGTPLKEELISITRGGKETVRVRREPPATAPEVAGKPVLRMRFDRSDFYERDGRTYARDLSGRGNDGLCEQARFTSHGKTGGGLENAGKGYLRLPSSLVAGQSNFTIAAWVKFLDSKKNWTIYTCMNRDYPAKVLPAFDFYHTHCMYVGAWCPPRTWIHVNSPEARIAPGEWAFVAVTLENGAPGKGQARLILNDRVYEKPLQHVGCSPEGVQDIAALNLNGVMDELTVWPRALTEQELRQLFASVAVTPIDHAREANAQLAKGRLDEAAEEFSKVLDTTADSSWKDAEPKRILAQIVTSDEVFPRVVKLRPKVIWLWSHRAHHLAEQGRWDEAEMGFRTRLELGGDGAGTWHNYAVASLVAQHPDTYRQVCETMLKTFEEVADPHEAWWVSWALALAPHSVKDKEKASRFAERAMKGLPNIASGSYPYAAWLYRLDRLDDSVDCWNKAGKADIEDVRLCFLAMAHHRLGNADLADRFARQARSKKADWAKLPTWYRRAYCELLLNEMEKVVSGKPD